MKRNISLLYGFSFFDQFLLSDLCGRKKTLLLGAVLLGLAVPLILREPAPSPDAEAVVRS